MLVTNECPRRSQPPDMSTWFTLFAHYRAGHLWADGGLSSQPQIYVEVMKVLEYWTHELSE